MPFGENNQSLYSQQSRAADTAVFEQRDVVEHVIPLIFLTGYGDVATTVHAMKAGACDFLTKPVQKRCARGGDPSRARAEPRRTALRGRTSATAYTLCVAHATGT